MKDNLKYPEQIESNINTKVQLKVDTNLKIEYAYSTNEEDFKTSCEIIDDLDENPDVEVIYAGEKVLYTHLSFVSSDNLLENMANNAYEYGEYAESYSSELDSLEKEHKDNLDKLIAEYLDNNLAQPTFFTVKNVNKITVAEFRKEFC